MRGFTGVAFRLGCVATGLVLSNATPASAFECMIPGGFFPSFYRAPDGVERLPRLLPADAMIVVECPTHAATPCLEPSITLRGQAVDLLELDRWPVSVSPPMEVVRYVPSTPLTVGEFYDVAAVRRHGDRSIAWTSQVAVIEGGADTPPLPIVRSVEYSARQGWNRPVRQAGFQFEPLAGMLVADVGEPDEDPWQNVDLSFASPGRDAFGYRVGVTDCDSNHREADLGVTTQVRFGQLDAAGRFSGWTPFYEVSYPGVEPADNVPIAGAVVALAALPDEGREEPIDEPAGDDIPSLPDEDDIPALPDGDDIPALQEGVNSSSGCALSAAGAGAGSSSWLFALCALYASRWLSSAARGSTSSRSRRSSVAGEPG